MSKMVRVGLFLSLFMLAFPVIAQDDDDSGLFPPLPLTQSIEVEGEDGDIGTFSYPEGWFTYFSDDLSPIPTVKLSNMAFHEHVDESGFVTFPPVLGQVVIDIFVMTPEQFELSFYVEHDTEWTPEQRIEEFVGDALVDTQIDTFLANDREAAIGTLTYDGSVGVINIVFAFVNIDGNIGFIVAYSLPDTLSRYTSTIREMLGAVEYIPLSNVNAESTAEARNNSPSSGDFVDERGSVLTVDVPDGWTSTTTDDRLILANSAFVLQSVLEDGDAPQIGDVLVSIATFPPNFDNSLTEINFNTDVQDTLLSVFSGTQDGFPALRFGIPQTITLDDSQNATLIDGTFARNGSQFEFTIIMVTMPTARVVLVAYGDELRPFRDALLEIAASSVYSP